MSHPDLTTFRIADDVSSDDPFTALRYHFGMLLGVDDFETEQAYHRGKLRLHQGWLHGPGVLWGLAVGLDEERDEVRVEPGLALDGAGREVHLDGPACLDPGAWYDRHEADVEPIEPAPGGADVAFDAHVEMRWASCLTRPVPALAEPCEDAGVETAHSRLWETAELRLLPGAAEPPGDRCRRVRILLGLLEPGDGAADQAAAGAREDVHATPVADRPAAALAAFRAMANADAIDLAPPDTEDGPRVLTPVAPPAPIVLANLRGLALRRRPDPDGGWELVGGRVELLPRRSHVAGETAQELAVAALAGGGDAASGGGAAGEGDPRILGVTRTGTAVQLALSAPLDDRSVRPAAFSVTALGASGWTGVEVVAVAQDPSGPTLTLELATEPAAPWQLLASGSGPSPLVDPELNRLGGGRDHVHLERS